MKWKNRQSSRNVDDRRRVGGKTIGGGIGFLVIAAIVALLGGDPSYFLKEGVSRTVQSSFQKQNFSSETQDEMVEFSSVVLAETEKTWQQQFAAIGQNYQEPTLVFFTGATSSGCGYAQSAIGPFYCPNDRKIYIDLDFFHDLQTRHNAKGDFAQAYVIAHEVGHHVQNLLGLLQQGEQLKRRNPREANDISVTVELMADCFAGVWAHDVKDNDLLEQGDITEALNAATQIGDDNLQRKSQGYVVPDSFTHGSGKQRYDAFKKGFESGSMRSCIS